MSPLTKPALRRRGVARVVLQVGRAGALCMALIGLAWIATADAFAAEDEPISLSLDLDDDPEPDPRFAVAMLIPDAEVVPPSLLDPSLLEPSPPPERKKKKPRSKLKFGRMDAY
jgi:hypothetical protein